MAPLASGAQLLRGIVANKEEVQGHKTNGEFYYSVDLSKHVKYKAEAAV